MKIIKLRRMFLGLAAMSVFFSVAGATTSSANPAPFADYVSTSYEGLVNWPCHPDLRAGDNICKTDDLDVTWWTTMAYPPMKALKRLTTRW